MKIFGLIVAFLMIALLDIPYLSNQKNNKFKYILTYAFIIVIGFIMSLLQIIKKVPPSPNKIIESLIKSFL